MGFHSMPAKLSTLEIDVDKDWAAKKIENLGIPDSRDDVPRWSDVGGAALIIAAADTPATLKNRADYVGDGAHDMGDVAGDEAEINTALGIADTVILCPGTYWVNNSISMASNKTLIGSGAGTVIKIRDSKNATLKMIVNSDTTDGNDHIVIKNLKLDGNKANNTGSGQSGIVFDKVAPSDTTAGCEIHQCFIENFYEYGIHILNSYNSVISGNAIQYGGGWGQGIYIEASSCNTISGNVCNTNEIRGIYIDATSPSVSSNNIIEGNECFGNYYGINVGGQAHYNIISNNQCVENEDDGIAIFGSYNTIVGNNCRKNGQNGICLELSCKNNVVVGNVCLENQQVAASARAGICIRRNADRNLITSNICRQGVLAEKPDYGIEVELYESEYCNNNVIQGNDLYDGGAVSNLLDNGISTVVKDNRGTEITDERDLVQVKNTSGGSLVAGDVVVLKAVAAGNEITTTTTQGDDKVFGMVAETIADNARGLVLVKGKSTALKVNGTTDIAIGDLIGCFTTAKIAMKAAAGKMAFAIALEAYATDDSNGVIDALLITPRQAI